MPLVVLSPEVLVDAIEGDAFAANLLTLLAYGKLTKAVDEEEQVLRFLANNPGTKLKGPQGQRPYERLHEQWVLMHDELAGLPDDWGLVTSATILHHMRGSLIVRRHLTGINPHAARHLVVDAAAAFAHVDDIADVRKAAPQPMTPLVATGAAKGAEYVVVLPPSRPWIPEWRRNVIRPTGRIPLVGGWVRRLLDSIATRVPQPSGPGPDHGELPAYWNGSGVRPFTPTEFAALEESPDLSAMDGTLSLIQKVFPPPASLRR